MQARTAAAAYEQAYAMTVLPPVIAAHRTLSAALVATNIVGQNTAAIADTEAQYADFWAQNAAMATANTNSGATKVATQAFSPLSTQPQPQVQAAPNLGAASAANSNAFRVLDAIQGTGLGFSAPTTKSSSCPKSSGPRTI